MAVGNTFGATALSSYGGFWLSFAVILTPGGFEIESSLAAVSATAFLDEFGLYLMVSSISPSNPPIESTLMAKSRAGSSSPSSSCSARSAQPSPSSPCSSLWIWHSCSLALATSTAMLWARRIHLSSKLVASSLCLLRSWPGTML